MQESTDPADLWEWLDDVDADPTLSTTDPADVTCVLVAHNGDEWLPRHLQALGELDPRPGHLIAVDNGSTDQSLALLRQAQADGVLDQVVEGSRDWGFGRAVDEALGEAEVSWLWLLHDDCAPRPDALGQLLVGIDATGAGVLYPKLLQPPRRNYPDALAEIGQSITASGRRVLSVEEGDIDQRQHSAAETLGGSTAGMLVSGEVWRALDGLSPQLPLHRDGVDFGWRAHQAGHKVSTWPQAAVMHRQAGRMNERDGALLRGPHEMDRLTALRLVAARGPRPTGRARLAAGSLVRSLGFLLGKSPRTASAELRALRAFLGSTEEVRALAERPAGDATVEDLRPGRGAGIATLGDRVGSWVAERYRELASGETHTSLDELTGDDFTGSQTRRTHLVSPVLLLVLGFLLGGLAASRSFLREGAIAGGGLLPAPRTPGAAWDAWLEPTVGIAGANAPWLGLAALSSSVLGGRPEWVSLLLVVLGPLLAALSAHLLLRRLGVTLGRAAGIAAAWAGAVILLGLPTAGDVSGLVLAIVAPLFLRALHRLARDSSAGAERLRSPAIAALWLVVMVAVWPFLMVLVTLSACAFAAVRRRHVLDAAVLVGTGWLFLAPWLPTLWRWPGRMLTGTDPLAWPAYPPAGIAVLVGRILPSGLPLGANVAFFGVLALVSLACVVRINAHRIRRLVLAGIAVPLLAGVALSRIVVEVPGGQARVLLSAWALMVVAGLLASIVVVPPGKNSRWLGAVLGLLGALAVGAWAWTGFDGPVGKTPSLVPGYVHDVMVSPRQTRVLLIDHVDASSLSWNVADVRQPQWGTGERAPAGTHAEELAGLVQAFAGGQPPEDLAGRLGRLGIGHVWSRGFGPDRLAALANVSGLTRAAVDEDTVMWAVDGTVSRFQLVDAEGRHHLADGSIIPSDQVRHLVVSEQPDERWRAQIAGLELRMDPTRPPVTFEVPAGLGGHFDVGLARSWRSLIGETGLLVVLVALALPTLGGRTAARRGL